MTQHSFDENAAMTSVSTASAQPGWHPGDECRVDGGAIYRTRGRLYDARILTLANINGVQMAELRITASVTGFDGEPVKQSWTHPKFVPTAKLRKALLK